MNPQEWIKYDGSDKQIAEINDSVLRHGFILRNRYGSISPVMKQPWHVALIGDKDTTHYLICKPHQYADLIKIWADTGCQVWYRAIECKDFKGQCLSDEFNLYPFARPNKYEYSLTPFED